MNHTFRNKRPALPRHRLIIGRKPLLEALDAAKDIEKIFILQTATGEEIRAIKQLAKQRHIPVSAVPQEKLNRLTRAPHQGVVAIGGLISFQPLQETLSSVVDEGKVPLVLVLDGITDTRNLGAIARSAYCYGAHALVIPAGNNAAVTEEAIKTSAGALLHLPVCRVASVQEAIDLLHLNGLQIVATTLQGTGPVSAVRLDVPIAFVLGAEDKGVSPYVLQRADHLSRIPMGDRFDSLNVSVAAGILLYEAFQQRQQTV